MTPVFSVPTSMPPAAAAQSRPAASSTDAPVPAAGDAGGTNTFLQLLIAEIKTQDPLSPMDSTNFVTQLAQFNSLEQLISINGNLEQLVNGANVDNSGPGNPGAAELSAALAGGRASKV